MNYFTEKSIELANQRDYLDLLFSVYPLLPDTFRTIDESIWDSIEQYYNNDNNLELIKSLLELDLFPIKDGYVPYLRLDRAALNRNPKTVNRICGRIKELGLDALYDKCSQPKETNRQMGPLFRRWIHSGVLGLKPVPEDVFNSNNDNAILEGTDDSLLRYAKENLGFNREDDKGIDFVARFNGKYVIGEAKFISAEGGHQNDQFLDAMTTLRVPTSENVRTIAILDGVLYIPSKRKMYRTISTQDVPVLSALLLREYLYSL